VIQASTGGVEIGRFALHGGPSWKGATIGQMRDLQRYASPVIMQNAGQVNIAADVGQQINVEGDISR
jgi:hypothetical protein